MSDGDHRAVRVEVHRNHHIVGITAVDGDFLEVPAVGVLAARVAHGDMVIERLRHLREIPAHLRRADEEQPPARPMHRLQYLAVELEQVRPFARLDAHLARVHVEKASGKLVALDDGKQILELRFRSDRLENDLQRTAAGKPEARRLLLRDAVGRDLGFRSRERLALHLVDEVVLDAAAGNRAHDLTIVANDEHRSDRPRSGAPGMNDRAQGGAVARFAPFQGAAHHFQIDTIHGNSLLRKYC